MDTREVEEEYSVSWLIVVFKYVSGMVEIALGLSIVFFGNQIVAYYERIKVQELLEDPNDLLIRIVESVLPYVLKHRIYIVLFLLVLGVAKVVGAVGLTYRREWGRDLLIILGVVLLPFDAIDFGRNPTTIKALYVAINVLFVLYLMNFRPRDYARRLGSRTGWRKIAIRKDLVEKRGE